MYAEETTDNRRPGQSFPDVPDRSNNFLGPREDHDYWVERDWSPYPINRIRGYLQWLAGVRWSRMIRLELTLVVKPLLSWREVGRN